MKKVLVLAVIAAAVLFGLKTLVFPKYEVAAQRRLQTMLEDMKEGTGTTPKAETAIALWATGANRLDNATLASASNNFDHWRQEKDLYRKFNDFSIDSSEEVKDAADPTAIFNVTIEGKQLRIKVPKGSQMSWVD